MTTISPTLSAEGPAARRVAGRLVLGRRATWCAPAIYLQATSGEGQFPSRSTGLGWKPEGVGAGVFIAMRPCVEDLQVQLTRAGFDRRSATVPGRAGVTVAAPAHDDGAVAVPGNREALEAPICRLGCFIVTQSARRHQFRRASGNQFRE